MLLHSIILNSVRNIKQERTASSIYYLLTGRRSIQTMQDAYIYGIEDYFGLYKPLSKQNFEKHVQILIQNGLLVEKIDHNQRRFLLCTDKTEDWLRKHASIFPFHYFKGMQYHEKAKIFYQRLLLLIQTFANTRENNFSFIPVVDKPKVEQWVRGIYKEMRGKERTYLNTLEKELVQILENLSPVQANIFVDRLTGYKHYGMSISQLADIYKKDRSDIQLLLVGITHTILSSIHNQPKKYPALSMIIIDYKEKVTLLGSTANTYQLFKQNYSPEEIAKIRNLKVNTIYDHLAEIAMHDPSFPFHQFISVEDQAEILTAIKYANSYKLKAIKDAVHSNISFFQIRLMLVLHHKLKEEGELFA